MAALAAAYINVDIVNVKCQCWRALRLMSDLRLLVAYLMPALFGVAGVGDAVVLLLILPAICIIMIYARRSSPY